MANTPYSGGYLSSLRAYKERFDALPQKTRRLLQAVAIGTAIVLIAGISARIALAPNRFRSAKSVLGAKLLNVVVSENYSGVDSESISKSAKAMNVDGKFYLIDFNNPTLCGNAAGKNACLYVAYTPSGDKVLDLYLTPTSIKDRSLFQVSDLYKDGFPCLKISQSNEVHPKDADAVEVYDYCYSAGTGSFIRIVDGLEKPVLTPSPAPKKTPASDSLKKKGKGDPTDSKPDLEPTPVLSPT